MAKPAFPKFTLPLIGTLFFPISGNPIGFNHFALAEWLLRENPTLRRVVWILSNGRHPDPTKPPIAFPAEERLALCRTALETVADPAHSLLARRAAQAGETLRLTPETQHLSLLEFGVDRAVRSAELVAHLCGGDSPGARLAWVAGTDLLRRMADSRIFSAEDLKLLTQGCHYHIPEREGEPLAPALDQLREKRGLQMESTGYPLAGAPEWLAPFLGLSSTAIRNAVEAGDPLGGMLPAPAAARLGGPGLYRQRTVAVRLMTPGGQEVGTRSALELAREALQGEVDHAARELAFRLKALRESGSAHTLAVAEASCGGLVGAALTGVPGASRFLLQSRFVYHASAKAALLGPEETARAHPAVSEAMAAALADRLRAESGSDFALAETGMAGPPDGERHSLKNGTVCLAWSRPEGTLTRTLTLNPFLTRREHQLHFALAALRLGLTAVPG
ncbi:MAG: CinA family protein [Deltaproteobacteria bacterium]|nr:CinA family protein [Deltaproteobacteria bacterium]